MRGSQPMGFLGGAESPANRVGSGSPWGTFSGMCLAGCLAEGWVCEVPMTQDSMAAVWPPRSPGWRTRATLWVNWPAWRVVQWLVV